MALEVGSRLGHYQVDALIGEGGMGQVYQATDTYMGHSVGRWEGDTLVVDVTHFNGKNWFDLAGNFHSDALHLVERFTLITADADPL